MNNFRFKMDNLVRKIDEILQYVENNRKFINAHMVDFLINKHWNKLIPEEIQKEIKTTENIEEAIQIFWDQNHFEDLKCADKFPAFRQFLNNSKKIHLTNYYSIEEAKSYLKFLDKNCMNTKGFMSEKKIHEVEVTASLMDCVVERVAESNRISKDDLVVVDAGDGKGYLSSRIALEFGIKVLGVDANQSNTMGAEARNQLLRKQWPSIKQKATKSEEREKPPEKLYKTTTEYIFPQTNFEDLIKRHFPESNSNIFCLSGLHTCGNLATSCLKIFNEQDCMKAICNIGCCYHHLQEEFVADDMFNHSRCEVVPFYGFPMSEYLRQKRVFVGRNARMLAAQSVDRVIFNKELPSLMLKYRSILEVILEEFGFNQGGQIIVGKIKCSNFKEYVQKSLKKLDLANEETMKIDFEKYEQKYEEELKFLPIFYLMRQTFSPVVEALIILDRLLFLKENGHENSFIVKMFDPVISPRCFGILSLK